MSSRGIGGRVPTLASVICVPSVYIALVVIGWDWISSNWLLSGFYLIGAGVLTYASIDYFREQDADRRRAREAEEKARSEG